ncbi:SRPBCC family protein [Paenibacillus harenae]|uniref:SRPBCC family protein n=1 Tax=Paenibacillus harenae TaxID=306543 RepID=UPI002792515B|nr:SRPBCC domain-containing protein [Paenibacillus harenae]MDQ0063092.1 uncharacterized protein YndB with AHSA1/START domain [Paenibacillus harenae]
MTEINNPGEISEVVVECSIWVDASKELVWGAVTEGEQLTKWYSPGSPWDVPELLEGGEAYFHHSPNEYHEGIDVVTLKATIVSVLPLKQFALRWEFESEGPAMVTSFLLDEENGGTTVTITETGYETEEQAVPTQEGYTMSLMNLKAHLEGRGMPY